MLATAPAPSRSSHSPGCASVRFVQRAERRRVHRPSDCPYAHLVVARNRSEDELMTRRRGNRAPFARGTGSKAHAAAAKHKAAAAPPQRGVPPSRSGSLIGRRVGQGRDQLEAALDRPEKRRRDEPIDTSRPGVSASDRRAGGGSTARRNSKRNSAGATAALEDSARDRPSRKSTRKSAGRSKRDSNLQRRQTRRTTSAKARASRSKTR